MKRRIIIIATALLIFAGLSAVGLNYLNRVVLPTKFRSLIVKTLEQQTGKTVSLESVQFNILRGLVLKNLQLNDGTSKLVSLKQASCNFFLPALFKRQIFITSLKLSEAEIFLERKSDNGINLLELLPQKKGPQEKSKFSFFVSRITVADSRVIFQDDTTSPQFVKILENVNAFVGFSLPQAVKFSFTAEIPGNPVSRVIAQGRFNIAQQQVSAKAEFKAIAPADFQAYYRQYGILVNSGRIDAQLNLKSKDNLTQAQLEVFGRDLAVSRDKISAKLNITGKADIAYNLQDDKLKFSGIANILGMDISGLQLVGGLKDVRGVLKFNEAAVSADNLTANCLGLPLEAKLSLTDYADPLLDVTINSRAQIDALLGILKDEWQISLPADIQGSAAVSVNLKLKPLSPELPLINGALAISDATVKLKQLEEPLKNAFGTIEFTRNQLSWQDFTFDYLTVPYKTSGVLTNFQAPGIQCSLSSRQLSLKAVLAINRKLAKLSKLEGRFNNSQFSASGDFDLSEPTKIKSEISAGFNFDLADAKELFKKSGQTLERLQPAGILRGQAKLEGDIGDFKSCAVKATITSSTFSLLGIKADSLFLDYEQAETIANIPVLHLELYGGTVEGSAKLNLASGNFPFWSSFKLTDVRLEKLKQDTALRNQDISGNLAAIARINGFCADWEKLTGTGQIFVRNGKLWQINLFKGLGTLLFTTDFTNIVFSEGSCNFNIEDKTIYTDNLLMKSNLANLSGTVKIGFDSTIDASLNVQVALDAPLSGTFRDVTTAILGQAERFGVIQISGTLKEPKYKFKSSVLNIIDGLKNTFLRKTSAE